LLYMTIDQTSNKNRTHAIDTHSHSGNHSKHNDDSSSSSSVSEKAKQKLINLLKGNVQNGFLPVRTDIIAARCADFKCWDIAAAAFEAQQKWLQVFCCRLMHVNLIAIEHDHEKKNQNNDTSHDKIGRAKDEIIINVFDTIIKQSNVESHETLFQYFLNKWSIESRSSVSLEKYLIPILKTTNGIIVSNIIFSLDQIIYEQLNLSSSFSFLLAKLQLKTKNVEMNSNKNNSSMDDNNNSSSNSLNNTQQMWSEIRSNLDSTVNSISGNNKSKLLKRSTSINSEILLVNGNTDTVLFTCGHSFNKIQFQTNLLPRFETQLKDRLNPKLPITVEAVVKEYNKTNLQGIQLPCPKCLYSQLISK